jgi:hypothetical protein
MLEVRFTGKRVKQEFRLWHRRVGDSIWERWSGGVFSSFEDCEDIARRDSKRRLRDYPNAPEQEYAISMRTVMDFDKKVLDLVDCEHKWKWHPQPNKFMKACGEVCRLCGEVRMGEASE